MSKSTGVGRHPPSQRTHGHSFVNGAATPEYNAWSSMKYRCNNPRAQQFANYGGRGISVCEKWNNSFEAFLDDIGQKPGQAFSLDRIDNNGNYEPNNCRWANGKRQARNRRDVNIIILDGREVSLPDAVERLGLSLPKVRQRLNRGWTVGRALT